MGKHEIRLRRQRLTARGADRFRNYDTILKRHEQDQRVKKVVRIFIFFVIILILILLLVTVSRWEERKVKGKSATSYVLVGKSYKETRPSDKVGRAGLTNYSNFINS